MQIFSPNKLKISYLQVFNEKLQLNQSSIIQIKHAKLLCWSQLNLKLWKQTWFYVSAHLGSNFELIGHILIENLY